MLIFLPLDWILLCMFVKDHHLCFFFPQILSLAQALSSSLLLRDAWVAQLVELATGGGIATCCAVLARMLV